LQRSQPAPFALAQLMLFGVLPDRQLVRLAPRLHSFAAHVSDAKRKDAIRRHHTKMFGARQPRKQRAMLFERVTLRHFHRRPESVIRARRRGISRSRHHMSAERIVWNHEIERSVDTLIRREL